MRSVINILVLIQSLLCVAQLIVIFVQYRLNKVYRGIGWWVLGSLLMALGVIFMPMVKIKSLLFLAMISNPLVLLGQIFLYIGIARFLDKKENRGMLIAVFTVFVCSYYYFLFFKNDISARTVAINVALAIVSMMTAFKLFSKKDRHIPDSAGFTGVIFFIYGCFLVIHFCLTLLLPPMHTYNDQETILIISFIVPIITSTLWTYGFIIMLNQRLNIESLMEKNKMQKIFNTIPDAAMITRQKDGQFIDVNDRFLKMTGYTYDELKGVSTLNINLWHNIEERSVFISQLDENGFCEDMEFIFERKDGSQFIGLISARTIVIYDVLHIVGVIQDITERKQAEEGIIESEEKYRSILNASPDDITLTDLNGCILMVSPAAKEMFGYEKDYELFVGRNITDFIIPEDVEKAKSNIMLMYKGGHRSKTEYHAVRKDQSIFHIEVTSEFIRNASGQPTKMLFIIRDVTERKLAEQKIQQLIEQLEIEKNIAQLNSITDSLTGLFNRRYFDEALSTEFYRIKRSGAALSLIMLDVDYFKKFNDSYGHLAGDDCLRRIGHILNTNVNRRPDIAARYGGEEFVVILPETEENGAMVMAKRIRQAVEELAIPHAASDICEFVTVSLGVVAVHTTSLETPEQVIALADGALYRAKNNGRNRIEVETSK